MHRDVQEAEGRFGFPIDNTIGAWQPRSMSVHHCTASRELH